MQFLSWYRAAVRAGVARPNRCIFSTQSEAMKYDIRFSKPAVKDLRRRSSKDLAKILGKVEGLGSDLSGDVTKLTNFTPEYRLRIGNFRVLFEVSGNVVTVHRIKHRRDAYS